MEIRRKRFYLVLLIMFCTITTIKIYQSAERNSEGPYYTVPDFSDVQVRYDNSVYFIETSLMKSWRGTLRLTPRVACALEAAALLHPAMDVYLLLVAPPVLQVEHRTEKLLEVLYLYSNFRIRRISLQDIARDTPVQGLCRSRLLHQSNHLQSHVSDVLRLVMLWRFGGVYLDTDVVTLRSLAPLGPDFIGAESDALVNGAVMGFGRHSTGHRLLEEALTWLADHFSPDGWANNGPVLLTAILRGFCKTQAFDVRKEMLCDGVRVLPPFRLHPIAYGYAVHVFQPNSTQLVKSFTKMAYTLHLWNQLTGGYKADLRDVNETAMAMVAKEKCPRITRISQYV